MVYVFLRPIYGISVDISVETKCKKAAFLKKNSFLSIAASKYQKEGTIKVSIYHGKQKYLTKFVSCYLMLTHNGNNA